MADGLQAEVALLRDWKKGRLGTVELVMRLEALKQQAEAQAVR